jgi:hypothetical protein
MLPARAGAKGTTLTRHFMDLHFLRADLMRLYILLKKKARFFLNNFNHSFGSAGVSWRDVLHLQRARQIGAAQALPRLADRFSAQCLDMPALAKKCPHFDKIGNAGNPPGHEISSAKVRHLEFQFCRRK